MRPSRGSRVLAVVATVATAVAGCGNRGFDPDPDVVARREQLYAASCVQCHGGPTGGQISDIPPRHNAQGHTWHQAEVAAAECTDRD